MNFYATTLDLDRKKDLREYERVMTYLASGYGMKMVHMERILVQKTYRKNTDSKKRTFRRKVRRVYLEYYAPYRVMISESQQE